MDEYTPAQAAALTGLPLSAVHKAIDSRLIRPRATRSGATVRRLLTKEQLVFLQLEAEGLRLLPLGTRREIAELLRQFPKRNQLPVGGGTALRIEIKPARRKVESQLKQLARMEEMVVSSPDIMRGTLVFKGTRIPVDLVADMLVQGATADEILEGYPALSKEKIAFAPVYMRAFPRRGRPSRRPWQGKKPRGSKSFPLSGLLALYPSKTLLHDRGSVAERNRDRQQVQDEPSAHHGGNKLTRNRARKEADVRAAEESNIPVRDLDIA